MKPRILFCNECSVLKTGYAIYGHETITRWHQTNKYQLAEHASYIESTDPRIQGLPWVVYANMPDPKNQDEVNRYNSNPVNQFGEWRLEDICLDFMPHIVCVPPGELVLTKNGYKPIENLTIGELVATHKGRFQPITKLFKRQHEGYIHSISFNGCAETLKLTPNHPVLVYKKRRQTNQKKSFQKIYENIEPEFVPSEEIKKGDLIVLPSFDTQNKATTIDISLYLKQFVLKNNKIYTKTHKDNCNILPQYIDIDYNFGIILGYILGDGHISYSGVSVMLTGDEEHYVDEFVKLCKLKFGLNGKITKCKDKYAITININSVLLSEFLSSFNYKEYIWNNKDFVKGLVRGLVRSDGCYKKNTVSFCSIKKELAHLYRILCLLLEIPVSIHKNPNAYEIEGYGSSARLLHEICEKHTEIYTHQTSKPLRRTQIINGYLVASVKRNRKLNYAGQVYNIEVDKDNSYIIQQSCVHNCDIRDYWMGSSVYRSPFRPYYNWMWMPTVDSYPQNEEWISVYKDVDSVFTYQDWSVDVLKYEGGGRINVLGSASPAADPAFIPMNQAKIKEEYGLSQYKIVGTVMRNQRRKLYPDLFASFRIFLNETGRNDILLYCHTSYPDLGWNIPELLLRYDLTSKVLFTYICRSCGHFFPAYFNDALTMCPKCHNISAGMSNVQNGVNNEQLAKIYNMFDLYTQISTAEGFGIPIIEAAACGVPVMATDYSAMTDIIQKLEAIPLQPLTLNMELETGCLRAVSDNELLIRKLKEFFSLNSDVINRIKFKMRQNYLKHYNWDITANKWMQQFDNIDVDYYEKQWRQPPRFHNPPNEYPQQVNNKDFARWLILNVLAEPRYLNSYMETRLIHDLNYGVTNPGISGMYFNESSSLFAKPNWQPFGRQNAFEHFIALRNRINYWENRRWQKIQSI